MLSVTLRFNDVFDLWNIHVLAIVNPTYDYNFLSNEMYKANLNWYARAIRYKQNVNNVMNHKQPYGFDYNRAD